MFYPICNSIRLLLRISPLALTPVTAWRRLLFIGLLCTGGVGCMPEDGFRHYAGAIGPDLYSRQTIANTSLLNAYTSSICAQAGLASGGQCVIRTTTDWKNFVDMGLYDIDQRCDSFLDGLYYKAKTSDSILAQISDTGSFTAKILDATSSSTPSIKIVAAAFGLAEDTFRNTNKTLLEALDATTVKSLVFRRQQDIKEQIYSTTIWNKPQALHALRTYLRVCMPFAIEMEANAVLTTAQRTDSPGVSPIVFAQQPAAPLPGNTTVIVKPDRRRPVVKSWASINTSGIPIDLPTAKAIQKALCFSDTLANGEYGAQTEAALKLFKVAVARQYQLKGWRKVTVTLDLSDIGKLRENQTCEHGAKNYLERALFENEGFLGSLRTFLKSQYKDAVNDQSTLDQLRELVQKYKDSNSIDSGPNGMFKNQITPDFVAAAKIYDF
ncbi:hypothetical protein [Mesorhizobium sp. B2-8-9]|uniref:hypothetical protein n=1 Tax=Mesorhizobium sp. B2-8-9 TaxID=2589899 RepID=UPI001125C49B|nr:hypothetical protein [Mesorhizobium sp. B2-8-9]TPI78492.1 hypothetical protein FJ423_16400 [Mesorhizobium sp. B2-8-9]